MCLPKSFCFEWRWQMSLLRPFSKKRQNLVQWKHILKLCESGTEEKKYKKQETSTNEKALPDWYSQKAWDPWDWTLTMQYIVASVEDQVEAHWTLAPTA